MKVLYSGGTICDYTTLQRLVLIADEIAFMDRPSVTFGGFGTIGHASQFRQFNTEGAPVGFRVYAPPSGPAGQLHLPYIVADLQSPAFLQTFQEGFARSEMFRTRFIRSQDKYGADRTGQDIIDALVAEPRVAALDPEVPRGDLMFRIDTPEARRETLKVLAIEASIEVTSALVVSAESGCIPVSDDPYMCRLIGQRSAQPEYVHQRPSSRSDLAMAIAQAVIPDEALKRIDMQSLFEYRHMAKGAYIAWSAEVDRLATRISEMDPDQAEREIPRIVTAEVRPRLIEYRHEMMAARDKLFGDLIKRVAAWELPTLTVSQLVALDPASAIVAFAAALAPGASGAIVDYFVKRREMHRRNSMAYLIGLAAELGV